MFFRLSHNLGQLVTPKQAISKPALPSTPPAQRRAMSGYSARPGSTPKDEGGWRVLALGGIASLGAVGAWISLGIYAFKSDRKNKEIWKARKNESGQNQAPPRQPKI